MPQTMISNQTMQRCPCGTWVNFAGNPHFRALLKRHKLLEDGVATLKQTVALVAILEKRLENLTNALFGHMVNTGITLRELRSMVDCIPLGTEWKKRLEKIRAKSLRQQANAIAALESGDLERFAKLLPAPSRRMPRRKKGRK